MSLNLPPITLAAGVSTAINFPGDIGTIAWIKIANASAYTVSLTNLGPGQDYLQPNEVNVWPMTGVTGAIAVTPAQDLTGVTSPISSLFVTIYLTGEPQPSGHYPMNLGLLTFVGNTVSTTTIGVLQNDGAAAGTTIIESTNAGSTQSNVLVKNDGTLTLYGDTALGPATPGKLFSVAPATASANAIIDAYVAMAVADLSVIGTFGSDNGAILSDGAGNLALKTLTAQAPVTLAIGSQETGTAILGGTESAAGNLRSVGVNFKTNMTRTPTSITLTAVSQANISSISVPNIFTYGFELQYQATAAAFTLYNGKYTTVGNCLLAVNAEAQTFDHHCDTCGRVTRGASLSALHLMQTPQLALSYTCPDCGAQECYDTHLTAADESDPTPQGSGAYVTTRGAQAALIRQLITALGRKTAP